SVGGHGARAGLPSRVAGWVARTHKRVIASRQAITLPCTSLSPTSPSLRVGGDETGRRARWFSGETTRAGSDRPEWEGEPLRRGCRPEFQVFCRGGLRQAVRTER